MYQTMGASWIRTDVYWDRLETASGSYSNSYLAQIDAVVANNQSNGENSLFTVLDTPAWARGNGTTNLAPPTDPATYASMLAFMATRYPGGGVALEVWNEPNNPAFYSGTAATYAAMACDSYTAVKAANASTTVVAGAVSGEDVNWLKQAYAAGLAGCYDVLSEHPYQSNTANANPATWEPILLTATVHSLMAQYGDGALPIWFTEFGFAASADGSAPQTGEITLANQATFTVRFLQVVGAQYPYVAVAMIYEGKDTVSGSDAFEQNLGLLSTGLNPKPVYGAVQGLYAGTDVPALPTDPSIPPTISTVSQTSGSSGTAVTIVGTNFTDVAAVDFGYVAATSFVVNSSTQITAIAPPQGAGSTWVTATSPYGTNYSLVSYTYVAPSLSSATPTSGPGGTAVTLTGANFTDTTKVSFGSTAATSFSVVSDTQIAAVAPAEPVGTQTIYVTTPSGTAAGGSFSYIAPVLSAVAPNSGSDGTTVTITGDNFAGATKVSFGSVAATSFSVVNDSQITAVTPAEPAGAETIYVSTPIGTSAAGTSYTYVAPTVSAASPTSGSDGTTVTITGDNFSGATKVSFGSVAATSFSVVNDSQITAVTPAEPAGAETIYVSTPIGTSAAGTSYTYVAPTVSAASPTSGSDGTTVTITGANFTGATKVSFGSTAAIGFSVVSGTQITAVAPAEPSGPQTIYVSTPIGTSHTTTSFTYVPPTLSGASPTSGSSGTIVTITGANFIGATKVSFGGIASTSFTVVSNTQITAVAPPQPASSQRIYVTGPSGTNAAGATVFGYLAPSLTSISLSSGPAAGSTKVVITGANLTGATQVKFGTVGATNFTVNSYTQITVNTPAESAGHVAIYVTTPCGTSPVSIGYTYTS